MFASILLFTGYLLLCTVLLYFISRKPAFILSSRQTIFAFYAKVAAGCVYGYFFLKYYNGDDTWMLHRYSITDYHLLLSDPLRFFREIFEHGYTQSQGNTFFSTENNYWKDLPNNLIVKLLALMNVLSRGNYYINVIFFNLIIFWAHYYLLRFFNEVYPCLKKWFYLFIFFMPPLLFWESGIRKDGIIFLAIAGFVYTLYQLYHHSSYKKWIQLLIWFALVFLMRNAFALALIPTTVLLFVNRFYKKHAVIYVTGFAVFIALFFLTGFLDNGFDLPQKMADRQHAFNELEGGSYLPIQQLTGSLASYVQNLPTALNHVLLRPYFSEAKNPLFLLAFAEQYGLIILLVFLLLYRRKAMTIVFQQPFTWFILILVITNYLLIGYVVPFLGAIIRYKVCFEAMLFCILIPTLFTRREKSV